MTLQLTPTLLSNTATYYWWWICCERRAYQCKEKIAIKCAFPFLIEKASLLDFAIAKTKYRISFMKTKNPCSEEVIHSELMRIWNTMLECMYIGCHTSGSYPGLNVRRRAFDMHQNLIGYLITVVHKLGWKKLELLR
jgi:hypothetical protein